MENYAMENTNLRDERKSKRVMKMIGEMSGCCCA